VTLARATTGGQAATQSRAPDVIGMPRRPFVTKLGENGLR
jgi:hypothetical protein